MRALRLVLRPILRLVGVTALLCAAFATLIACGSNSIPPTVNYATLTFTVTDAATGAPIAGATVIVNTVLSATTNSSGVASIYPVPPGAYDYTVSAPGYQTVNGPPNATAPPGTTQPVAVALHH